jgi:hypothetical protein
LGGWGFFFGSGPSCCDETGDSASQTAVTATPGPVLSDAWAEAVDCCSEEPEADLRVLYDMHFGSGNFCAA